jgi:hypothetical protein
LQRLVGLIAYGGSGEPRRVDGHSDPLRRLSGDSRSLSVAKQATDEYLAARIATDTSVLCTGALPRRNITTYTSFRKPRAFELLSKEESVEELYAAIQRAVAAVQPVLFMEETPSIDTATNHPAAAEREPTKDPTV